ncbi:hypothetical protein EDD16DRAFT_983736 [Pisolithus croceorrhizus]|nr:hypothetical protein EDD16DRAFT_983736 [Pisolithus croceorrhizus]
MMTTPTAIVAVPVCSSASALESFAYPRISCHIVPPRSGYHNRAGSRRPPIDDPVAGIVNGRVSAERMCKRSFHHGSGLATEWSKTRFEYATVWHGASCGFGRVLHPISIDTSIVDTVLRRRVLRLYLSPDTISLVVISLWNDTRQKRRRTGDNLDSQHRTFG